MQRVRIGLTGLAGVFLLVLAAAAFFGLARHEPEPPLPGMAVQTNLAGDTGNDETPKEPLAELGVTPGNLPDSPAPAVSPPAAAPPTPARR